MNNSTEIDDTRETFLKIVRFVAFVLSVKSHDINRLWKKYLFSSGIPHPIMWEWHHTISDGNLILCIEIIGPT